MRHNRLGALRGVIDLAHNVVGVGDGGEAGRDDLKPCSRIADFVEYERPGKGGSFIKHQRIAARSSVVLRLQVIARVNGYGCSRNGGPRRIRRDLRQRGVYRLSNTRQRHQEQRKDQGHVITRTVVALDDGLVGRNFPVHATPSERVMFRTVGAPELPVVMLPVTTTSPLIVVVVPDTVMVEMPAPAGPGGPCGPAGPCGPGGPAGPTRHIVPVALVTDRGQFCAAAMEAESRKAIRMMGFILVHKCSYHYKSWIN